MQPLAKLTQRLLPWAFAVLILITVGSFPAAAQDAANPRFLTAAGHGHDQTPTTLAAVTLGISDKGDSAKATYDAISKRSSTVVKMLNASKADEVKTSNINLTPQYGRDGKPEKATFEGYRTVEFQLPLANIDVLDKALVSGVDQLQTIRYRASDEATMAARDRALENAIADAQAQAKVALDKLGFSLQEVVDIRIDNVRADTPETQATPADNSYSSGRWSDSLPVVSGEQAVDVSVTLKVRY